MNQSSNPQGSGNGGENGGDLSGISNDDLEGNMILKDLECDIDPDQIQ